MRAVIPFRYYFQFSLKWTRRNLIRTLNFKLWKVFTKNGKIYMLENYNYNVQGLKTYFKLFLKDNYFGKIWAAEKPILSFVRKTSELIKCTYSRADISRNFRNFVTWMIFLYFLIVFRTFRLHKYFAVDHII